MPLPGCQARRHKVFDILEKTVVFIYFSNDKFCNHKSPASHFYIHVNWLLLLIISTDEPWLTVLATCITRYNDHISTTSNPLSLPSQLATATCTLALNTIYLCFLKVPISTSTGHVEWGLRAGKLSNWTILLHSCNLYIWSKSEIVSWETRWFNLIHVNSKIFIMNTHLASFTLGRMESVVTHVWKTMKSK